MHSVLVTGATGFVGSNLLYSLVDKYELHIIAQKNSNFWRISSIKDKLNIHYLDISNYDEVKQLSENIKIDTIFHLAAYATHPSQTDVRRTVNTNVIGSFNLVNCFYEKGIKMFINMGSCGEYGMKSEPIKEDMLLEPYNIYSACKASSNLILGVYAKLNKLSLLNIRLFSPYGYYEAFPKFMTTVITKSILNNDIIIYDKNARRDYIFIEDVIEFLLLASNRYDIIGETYNLGFGEERIIDDVARIVTTISKSKSKIVYVTPDFPKPPEPPMWVCNMTKTTKDFEWKPKHTLVSGIEKAIYWYRENIHLYM